MAFKPIIHECEIFNGDETFKFWVREPSGREVLVSADKAKRNLERPSIENARELFAKYIVKENGDPIGTQDVEDILDMRLSAMQEVSTLVQEKIGLTKLTAKNA